MKQKYSIKSERYNYTHHLVQINDNEYRLAPAEDWMPIYINGDFDNVYVDTEGGPMIGKGWSNDEIEIVDVSRLGEASITFIVKEKPKA